MNEKSHPLYTSFENFEIIKQCQRLPNYGVYQYDPIYPYCYLKIDDAYIHC